MAIWAWVGFQQIKRFLNLPTLPLTCCSSELWSSVRVSISWCFVFFWSDISGRGAAPGMASLWRVFSLPGLESVKLMLLMSSKGLSFSLKVQNEAFLFSYHYERIKAINKCLCSGIYHISNCLSFHAIGNHYWGIRGNTVLPGYPKPLRELGFPLDVTKVDAAVNVMFTGRTLFFVQNKYWRWVIWKAMYI